MAQEVFRRVEKKFMLTARQAEQLIAWIEPYMLPDAYNRGGQFYTISNLYYDTDDSALIRESLRKPIYKEKLRLRGYGVPKPDDSVFLEMKKKYDGVVSKRRTQLPLRQAYAFLASGRVEEVPPGANRQVLHELSYLLSRLPLRPQLYLAYDRMAWFSRSDSGFRLTLDYRIRCRRHDLRLELGDEGEPLLRGDLVLMELKAEGAMPLWMSALLTQLHLRPCSFSKYGAEYQRHLTEQIQKEEPLLCLSPSLQHFLAAQAIRP